MRPDSSARNDWTVPPARHDIVLFDFHGFYESVHNMQLDRAIEGLFEDDVGDINEKALDEFHGAFSLTDPLRLDYCKEYVDMVKDHIEEEAGLSLPSMRLEEVSSPREYNFRTDQIIVSIDSDDLAKLQALFDKPDTRRAVSALVGEECASRSGFISFYSNDLRDWEEEPLHGWDHNQLGFLLKGAVGGWNDVDLVSGADTFHERVSDMVERHMSPKARKIVYAADRRLDSEDGPSLG